MVEVLYSIGPYLSNEKSGKLHIDQVYEYVSDENGISVTVVLEDLTAPRLSTKINIDRFVNNWTECEETIKKI